MTDTKKPRVICPVCFRRHSLTVAGTLHPHGPVAKRCLGSWNPPMDNQVQSQQPPPGI